MATTQTPSKPVVGQTFKQLSERTWKAQAHIIKPWLKEGQSALIWAGTGVGKTQLSLTLGPLAAGGGTAAGWSNDRPRKVLIIDGEMRLSELTERLVGLAKDIEGLDLDAAKENIEVRARQDQEPGVEFYDLAVSEDQDAISKYVREKGIELLILDNITTLTDSIKDENGAADVKPFLKFLLKMKRDGVATIVLHHANKGGSSYRGSTGIATTFEVIMGLQRPKTAAPSQMVFTLGFEKFREKRDETLATRSFELKEYKWTVTEDDESDMARLVQAIRSCELTTQQGAGDSLGFSKDKTSKVLKKAVANGIITKQQIRDSLEGDLEFAV
ncbi:MAG TPA: AAA family ATPase [Roseomonas sp.]|nr:AAA family ATPase [Roseomonas sp.]